MKKGAKSENALNENALSEALISIVKVSFRKIMGKSVLQQQCNRKVLFSLKLELISSLALKKTLGNIYFL